MDTHDDPVGGVRYDLLDPFKQAAQRVASATDGNIRRLGLEVVPESRGESAFLFRSIVGPPPSLIASVPETLGTKNLVADSFREISNRTHYDAIAQDTVAMNVNDLITVGALPVVVGAHIAAGSSEWFADEERVTDLLNGWRAACDISGCVYGPGESPALTDLVTADSAVLSGFGIGVIREPEHLIRSSAISDGDAIVLLASSGIHANGLTLARRLAASLPQGYATTLSDGSMLGAALLQPTTLYSPVLERCQDAGVQIHYAVNITGHGFRKLMRAIEPFRYTVEELPIPSPLFEFLIDQSGLSQEEAYATFNMGAGFGIYVDQHDSDRVVELSKQCGVTAWVAGRISRADQRSVGLAAIGVTYDESSLQIR